LPFHVLGHDWAALPTAHLVQRKVVRDAQQPRAQLATCRVEAGGATPEAHINLLRQLLGDTSITSNAEAEGVDGLSEAVVELAERVLIALGHQRDQGDVVQRGIGQGTTLASLSRDTRKVSRSVTLQGGSGRWPPTSLSTLVLGGGSLDCPWADGDPTIENYSL